MSAVKKIIIWEVKTVRSDCLYNLNLNATYILSIKILTFYSDLIWIIFFST